MTTSPTQQDPRSAAGQTRSAKPLAVALPCAILASMALAATVSARAPDGPKCAVVAISAPGFASLDPQTPPACIRIRI